ncbi:HAD family hydrolase [Pseudomonas sp. CFBP 8772]|uniref:HAD family hydrolase n=1 Tax=Pseudomonas sp. CFBP 8772 TaxID=2775284 RepID=UPI00177D0CFA|nr:HAD family hydrolase [Pseudomonas sp. CFBP 8772]MBD8599528.1 HAD family hydrolase [Pseudomonas sp. CFBP 8772]MBF9245602.1 HAD family hydrolase [Pseudomonas syringae pv. tomato]MBW8023308.1 HAD family hydrolase [Pseudomonas syringae pv. tomato]
MVDAIIFDAFGTILQIGPRTNPYLQLFREGRRQGRILGPNTIGCAMTMDLSLDEFAAHLGINLRSSVRKELNRALALELSSIRPYPEALEAIEMLQKSGCQLGICSNLAAPFGRVVRELFPMMNGYALSYEQGIMKPDPKIYLSACDQMGVEPGDYFGVGMGRVLMIGDSPRCDRDGPRVAGIMGLLLRRTDGGKIRDLTQFARLVIDRD